MHADMTAEVLPQAKVSALVEEVPIDFAPPGVRVLEHNMHPTGMRLRAAGPVWCCHRSGSTPQISVAYARIVRSEENMPMLATLCIAFEVHRAPSR